MRDGRTLISSGGAHRVRAERDIRDHLLHEGVTSRHNIILPSCHPIV
jgi:hypothetical protein